MKALVTEEHFTIQEMQRAYRELSLAHYQFDDFLKVVEQARKNRVYDEAMKAHDSRPDLRSQ